MSAAKEKDQADFDLERLVDMLDGPMNRSKSYRSESSPAKLLERYNNA
jgi:hypothetical protein